MPSETLAGSSAPTVGLPKMTYEEFLEWVPEDFRAEWVDGNIIPMAPPSTDHQDISLFLAAALRAFAETKKLGKVLAAPVQVKIGAELGGREPDIIFLANEHLDRVRKNHIAGPVDLAVEIIGPDSRGRGRGEKYYEYEAGGVREYWLIDPLRRQTEFYQLDESGTYALIPPVDGRYASRELPGLWIETRWLWQPPTLLEVLRAWALIA